MARQSPQPFENPMFREIHKNTWLKKISTNTTKKKREKLWVVFCIHDDTDAYLESYTDSKLAVFHKPEWFVCLNHVQHISPTICAQDQEYEFVLTLSSEVVRLAAPTWEQMLDWVEGLKAKLFELKLLSPKENVYTKLPEKPSNVLLLATRDPTSPLPPPPETPAEVLPGIETSDNEGAPARERINILCYERQRSDSQSRATIQRTSITPHEPRSAGAASARIFNFDQLHHVIGAANSLSSNNVHYEHLFQVPGPSSRMNQIQHTVREPSLANRVLERSASCSPRILQSVPRPTTLREQQVLMLEKEMMHPTGVRLQLRKNDCISSIGFVDAFNSVWICGWKQKEYPMLYNALHIGDRLLSIEGITVGSAAFAQEILQSRYCGLYVSVVIKRVPYGRVFVIHKECEGQSLGIIQENNTAVIQTVQENSLAARHGLTARTKSCDGTTLTNWVLTEINGRPLNLFFKKNQVRDRLNSVGRDISILVQPLDLIKQLKKQMKSLKNYKDYIVQ
ncbi:uncharacterized protein LOC115887133 [Sitophilus oryzae]|uniref:Uncharacterized protein LOC115887133 n=1 Tax=Sitophilus oryzae TaxID=7048 RepID=A0A6J2YGA5_SITOR|nr:uncharacterized protein LOC115887133 [Sitophilus oryzae]